MNNWRLFTMKNLKAYLVTVALFGGFALNAASITTNNVPLYRGMGVTMHDKAVEMGRSLIDGAMVKKAFWLMVESAKKHPKIAAAAAVATAGIAYYNREAIQQMVQHGVLVFNAVFNNRLVTPMLFENVFIMACLYFLF